MGCTRGYAARNEAEFGTTSGTWSTWGVWDTQYLNASIALFWHSIYVFNKWLYERNSSICPSTFIECLKSWVNPAVCNCSHLLNIHLEYLEKLYTGISWKTDCTWYFFKWWMLELLRALMTSVERWLYKWSITIYICRMYMRTYAWKFFQLKIACTCR